MQKNINVQIYKEQKSPTQSALSKTKKWRIKFNNTSNKYNYSLMNWIGTKNNFDQIKLSFLSLEDAKNFAKKQSWEYNITTPQTKNIPKKSYANNFK